MLKSISLGNFKCFDEVRSFQFSKINVLTGYNGRGKSSVFQAFLLLAQSYYQYGHIRTLELNGDLVTLDTFHDLINGESPDNVEKKISISLESDIEDVEKIKLGFVKKEEQERQGELVELIVTSGEKEKDYSLNEATSLGNQANRESVKGGGVSGYPEAINKLFEEVRFVSADRQGPTLFEKKHDLSFHNPTGKNGEYTLNVIAHNNGVAKASINDALSDIMDGGEIILEGDKDKTNPVISLSLKIGDKRRSAYKSINCGFGYSYILSVLANAVTMKKGMLFIENPEAHLHPKAQSRLIEFLCKQLSDKDIQIFIETHSEHVLNAVRLCALDVNNSLTYKDVSLYFFDKDFSCTKLEMDENTQIDNWPSGFFDQQEIDLARILKLGVFRG